MVILKPVHPSETNQLMQVAQEFWQELMPHADTVQDADQCTQYFHERFPLDQPHHLVQWAMVKDNIVGFVAAVVEPSRKRASIEDFYILPTARHKGYGTETVRALVEQFDALGIERVDLNVRRDNPNALAFWEAQGFRIALYHMRQYRDPQSGESFIGALSSDFEETK